MGVRIHDWFPYAEDVTVNAEADDQPNQKANRTQQMTLRERWSRTYALWPYMIPLILVYFAEYSMQVMQSSMPSQLTALFSYMTSEVSC